MSHSVGVPNFIADVMTAISLLTMLVAGLFARYRVRR
jgi:simple sugar transport system permease protein